MKKDLPPIRLAETNVTIDKNPVTGKSRFVELLEKHFPIEYISRERYREADFLITGDSGFLYEKFSGVRIFTTCENHDPDMSLYDYCLTHSPQNNDRCRSFPYWLQRLLLSQEYRQELDQRRILTVDELLAQKREFCTFICRNHVCRTRNSFVKHLNKRKRVNCPGPFLHNTDFVLGKTAHDKHMYQRRHLFSVAFENEAAPGYTTEKILDAFAAQSIPIYWGDPLIEETFNPDAFVHARRFASEKELIDYVINLSEDPERCVRMLNAPIFRRPDIPEEKAQEVLDFMEAVFRRGPCIRRTRWQRINGVLSRFYGHGLFRTLRRISRTIRGKKIGD